MTLQTLDQALALTALPDGPLSAEISGDFFNGPVGQPPEAGAPFGGLLAALCAEAMRIGLGLTAPLRTLSVQYLTAPRFGQTVTFTPRVLRAARTAAFVAAEASQSGRMTHHATAVFGADVEGETVVSLHQSPPPLDSLDPKAKLSGPMTPRFAQHVEYRFDGGPNIFGGNADRPAVERVWMRCIDGRPLDDARLCYLLDALYPPAWTAFRRPPPMSTIDLRYDILADLIAEPVADGWAFFEFRMLDFGGGWTVDETTAWRADGRPLAVARQRRKLAAVRPG